MRCEGWTRRGGAFTLGPVQWSQCENEAVVLLEVEQKKNSVETEITKQPACIHCWLEVRGEPDIKVFSVEPIDPDIV